MSWLHNSPGSQPGWSIRPPPSRPSLLLRTVFTVAPILFGLDKFANIMVHWPQYLAPIATQIIPVSGQQFMYAVGVVEIIAGLLVAWRPADRLAGGRGLATGIIINPSSCCPASMMWLRDSGLLVAALALNRLATARHGELRR